MCTQYAVQKLGEDAARYDEMNPGVMGEAAKKKDSMWTEMAQLLRSELLHNVLIIIH